MPFVPPLAEALARPGRVAIRFTDEAGDPARPVTLHAYRPAGHRPDSPVVIVQHGMGRNGDDYRDFWVEAADRHGLLIVAPTFSNEAYPGHALYNDGHVLDAEGAVRPAAARGYKVPARVFAALRAAGITTRAKAHNFGHSAGGQFLHRLLSTEPTDVFEAATVGNPGWYTLPTLDQPFAVGLGGIGVTESDLLRLLAFPMTILAGEQDTEMSEPSLPSHRAAAAQGPHRFARAQFYVEAGRAEASRRGVPFGWRLITVPRIGHDGAAMSRVAASLWFEGQMPPDEVLAEWALPKAGAL